MSVETRKQELWNKVNGISQTLQEEPPEPTNQEEAIGYVKDTCYWAAIDEVKSFLDRDCKGKPLSMIVETPYYDPSRNVTEDRVYTAKYGHTPHYEQVIFDQLKKYHLVQDDCQLNDYGFLFPAK